MTIQFPKEYTALFKDFFADFDDDLEKLDIQTYGMSITTLEQVFLEIGHDQNPKPRIVYGDSPEKIRPGTSDSEHGQQRATPNHFTDDLKLKDADNLTGENATPQHSDRRLIREEVKEGNLLPPIQ